ncbi:MAG TPA: hypothetical protein VLJ39_10980, partial [Tepidisphaeraceae bacterium]|nr:hypothetical protein [Tepidisphaeraceae bacterium]
ATATLLVREEAAKSANPAVELSSGAEPSPKTFTATPLGDQPGVFRVDFGKLPEGRYQARIPSVSNDVSARTVFDVRAVSQEQLDLQVRPDLMARVASDSGGSVVGDGPARQIAEQFQNHLTQSRPPRYERTTAWDRPWALLLIFGAWCLSWVVRRSGGLV